MHKGNGPIVKYAILREEAVNLVKQLSNQSSSNQYKQHYSHETQLIVRESQSKMK